MVDDLFIIGIDPGHPSFPGDTGCHHGNLIEKDYTLEIAQMLRNRILDRQENIGVLMTRWQDEPVDFDARVRVLEGSNPRLVLSLHVDSIQDERVRGMQAFRLLGGYLVHAVGRVILGKYDRPGYYISDRGGLKKRTSPVVIARPLDGNGKKHWTRNAWHVLHRFEKWNPLLIEMGFATNPEEREWLLSDEGKGAILMALEAGVLYAYEEFRNG